MPVPANLPSNSNSVTGSVAAIANPDFVAFAEKRAAKISQDITQAIEADLKAPVKLQEVCKDFDISSLHESEVGLRFLNSTLELWEQLQEELLLQKLGKRSLKVARRASYVNRPEIEILGSKSGKCRGRYSTGFATAGLMECMLRHLNIDTKGKPVVLNLVNRLPEKDSGARPDIPLSEADNFNQLGYKYVQGKTLWTDDSKVQEIFDTVLPTAIDFSSYHSRFRAPLLPGGYLPDLTVAVKELRDDRGQSMEADGSGLYDPEHPAMASLVEAYGAVGFQFTMVNPFTGHMFKGMLFPRQGLNSKLKVSEKACAIQLDYLQCKGAHKSAFKKLAKSAPDKQLVLDGIHLGVIKAKTSWGKVSACFENIEVIRNSPLAKSIIASLQKDMMDDLLRKGPMGLLAQACQNDDSARRLCEFIAIANSLGAKINPLAIPHLRNLLEISLAKKLWKMAQGGGITGQFPIVAIDATLKPGTCVVRGKRVGSELASWRMPNILAQGAKVLVVARPKSHHMIDGEVIPYVIWMHPDDITGDMQGDDDGDEVGISDDPRIVKLFKERLDNAVFHVEPVGEKFTALRNSPEGIEYIRVPPMGPVGPVTIFRSKLLAVGARMAAKVAAVLCQEAIDSGKNLVRMTCPYKASDIKNWHCEIDDKGVKHYHIHFRDPNTGEWLTDNWATETAGEFDLEMVKAWADGILIQRGCYRMVKDGDKWIKKAGWPLGWRRQTSIMNGQKIRLDGKKTIAIDNWQACSEKQNGDFRNLVHFAHDNARRLWMENMSAFKVEADMPTRDVLGKALAQLNISIQFMPGMTLTKYHSKNGLREKAGLVEYGKALAKAMGSGYTGSLDPESRMAAIDAAKAALDLRLSECTAQELYTIWCAELTPTEWYKGPKGRIYCKAGTAPEGKKSFVCNKPSYAFMAVTSKHSAIMKMMGMEASVACDFLVEAPHTDKSEKKSDFRTYVDWCMTAPYTGKLNAPKDEFEALTLLIAGNKKHALTKTDADGNPIHLSQCRACCERLETGLVRAIRADKALLKQSYTQNMITAFNKLDHEPVDNCKDFHDEESDEHLASHDHDIDLDYDAFADM